MYKDQQGKTWWKGNLHTHTKESDGRKTPQEAIEWYQQKGYDFLSLTDHWKISEKGQYQNMLLYSGIELDSFVDTCWHIVGIDLEKMPTIERGCSAQEMIDAIRAAGGLAILAHPAWSLDEPQDIAQLTGLSGAEIFNSVSMPPYSARPDSSAVLDLASKYGFSVPYMAADDAHYYLKDTAFAYIYVQADELTHEAIREAIEAGRLYATQGPVISCRIEDGKFMVDMDDACQVVFFSESVWNRDTCTEGEHLTHAEFVLKPNDHWVRAEVTNAAGQRAWTSAYRI